MGVFFLYMLKVSVCSVLFYGFYKLLLSKETFHTFNRVALIGIVILSFLLPLIQLPMGFSKMVSADVWIMEKDLQEGVAVVWSSGAGGWYWLILLYFLGIGVLGLRQLLSFVSMFRLIRQSKCTVLEGGVRQVTHNRPIAPFSWMRFVVLSEHDLQENGPVILMHEKAHIQKRHSWDMLLLDGCIILQWFNPVAWLLRNELRDLHEFEADEQVINQGIDVKKYQLLLIEKAVGTRLYSMSNSFNHSSLKKRITMMMKRKSNPWARMKYLYVLPLAAIAVAAFARPEVSSELNEISSVKISDLSETVKEAGSQSRHLLSSVLPSDGKQPVGQQPEKVYDLVEQMPEYPGGMAALLKFLRDNLKYPEDAVKEGVEGRVVVQFVVRKDGTVSDIGVVRNASNSLDAEAVRVVSLLSGKMKPGRIKGEPVNVKYNLPIVFKIPPTEEKSAEK